MKTCSKCKETKAKSEFGLRGYTRKDGSKALASWCKACYRAHVKSKYPEKRERISKYMKKKYDSDPEAHKEKTRKWREENKDKMKDYNRKWHEKKDRFKIALQCSRRAAKNGEYKPCSATLEELEVSFTGRCGICGVPELECSKKLVMDHDHRTGVFRGWLCRKCNSALGFFNDNEELLIDALHYLMQGEFK